METLKGRGGWGCGGWAMHGTGRRRHVLFGSKLLVTFWISGDEAGNNRLFCSKLKYFVAKTQGKIFQNEEYCVLIFDPLFFFHRR